MVGDTSWKYEKDRVENLASPFIVLHPKMQKVMNGADFIAEF